MGKHKTVFVWILMGLISVWLVFGGRNIIGYLTHFSAYFGNFVMVGISSILFSAISWLLWAILLYKLYNVKKDVRRWVHYSFGFGVFQLLLAFVFALQIGATGTLSLLVLFLLIELSMWKGITMHLQRAERDKLMEFN